MAYIEILAVENVMDIVQILLLVKRIWIINVNLMLRLVNKYDLIFILGPVCKCDQKV